MRLLADQLDDNEIRIKLQTEIRRLVDRVVLHMKIQKFIIYYHTPKWIVRFKSGKSQLFIESDGDLIATKDILTQEYETESHRLSLMTRSQDEIKRLADQLDDNEIRMKLQTEIRRLVDRIILHMKIQKFIIYYHTPKWIVRFKSGKSQSFVETDGELIDDPF